MQLNHIKHICTIFKYIHLMYGPKHKNAHQYYYFLCFITWNHVMTMLCIFFLYFLIFPCDSIAYFDIFQTYSTPKLSPSHFLTICEKTKKINSSLQICAKLQASIINLSCSKIRNDLEIMNVKSILQWTFHWHVNNFNIKMGVGLDIMYSQPLFHAKVYNFCKKYLLNFFQSKGAPCINI